MNELPHRYLATAEAHAEGDVFLKSEGAPSMLTAPPPQFGGPGDRWSPETLLMAAVADCFVFTFRALARNSQFPWIGLSCRVEGVLDRVDKVTRFTELVIDASLRVPEGADKDGAQRLLERAEQGCLITNSLKASPRLQISIEMG